MTSTTKAEDGSLRERRVDTVCGFVRNTELTKIVFKSSSREPTTSPVSLPAVVRKETAW